jgi:hypothetical protein
MSLVSFAPTGGQSAGSSSVRGDQVSGTAEGDQQLEKQQQEQELAHEQRASEQRASEQLHQVFSKQEATNVVANIQADASIDAIVASARASASAALNTSAGVEKGVADGSLGLRHAASAVADARATINEAKLVALRETEHGDLADLVQLDQQVAQEQGAIVVNLLV